MRHGERRTENGKLAVVMVMALLLSACHRNNDAFVGRWTVERVNVEFDERYSSPEMVRQFGEMEKDNVILIEADSVLSFVLDGDTLRGRYSVRGNQILWNEEPFGTFEEGHIKTKTSTPMGDVKASYVKSN